MELLMTVFTAQVAVASHVVCMYLFYMKWEQKIIVYSIEKNEEGSSE